MQTAWATAARDISRWHATCSCVPPQHHYGELLAGAADETWIHPVNDMLVMPSAELQADPKFTGIENPARSPYMLPSWE